MPTVVRAVGGDALVAAADSLTLLYTAHYRGLVRLAAYLTNDRDAAEEIVQDAYVKVLGRWGGLRDLDKGEAYLRQTVVNLSRSRLRHRSVVERHAPAPMPDTASAESGALTQLDRSAVVRALHDLPRRQREALVLRFYADLSEAQTAYAMGISAGAVKSHTSRGMAALRQLLEEES
jgi:RNA polymerase sigma-70 factor (sigma-E family)